MGANGIYGLSGSGLDIESLVKVGMLNKQHQYDKMQQQETTNTWMKEEWATLYDKFTTYKYSTLTDYKMQSNMSAMMATSGNANVVTATANGAAAAMTHKVEISQTASNAYMMTKDSIERVGGALANSTSLSDVMYKSVTSYSDKDGNKYYTIKFADGTSKNVAGSDNAVELVIQDQVADDPKDPPKTYTLSYTYDDLMDKKKTLYDFATDIAKTGANIQGNYDSATDSFSLYNKSGGAKNIIGLSVVNKDTAELMDNLHLAVYNAADNKLGDKLIFSSQDAQPSTAVSGTIKIAGSPASSLKDMLNLSASVSKNDDGSYTLSMKDNSKNTTKVTGSLDDFINGTVAGQVAFSMQVSDGVNSADVNFTYGDIFDFSKLSENGGNLEFTASDGKSREISSSYSGNLTSGIADLSTVAEKINKAISDKNDEITAANLANGTTDPTMTIIAAYDAAKGSFSLVNTEGKAELTSNTLTASDGKEIGNHKISDDLLNNITANKQNNTTYGVAANDTDTLAAFFGIKSISISFTNQRTTDNKKAYEVYGTDVNNNKILLMSKIPSAEVAKLADKTFSTISLDDGNGNTTDVNITYGELFNLAKLTDTSGLLGVNGVYFEVGDTKTASVSSNKKLEDLVSKINEGTTASSMGTVNAVVEDGKFKLTNTNGNLNITTTTAMTSAKLEDKLGKWDSLVSDNISSLGKSQTDSLQDVLGLSASLVKEADGKYTISMKDAAGNETKKTGTQDEISNGTAFSFQVDGTDDSIKVNIGFGELFNLDFSGADGAGAGKAISLAGDASFNLASVADKITVTGADKDISAEYDAAKTLFSITNEHGHVSLSSSDKTGKLLLSSLNVKENPLDRQTATMQITAGTDAVATIDGKEYTLDSNSKTIAGVTYTFVGDTKSTGPVNIVVNHDTDKVVEYVKKFVDDYNTLLDYMNDKLSEERYKDYKPLTSMQEEQMTETQINKWTDKAKSGLLYHNSTLQDIVSQMREAIYTPVDAVDSIYNTAASIGISSSTVKGHLTLDEDKLRKALAADPDCAYQIFASDQDSSYIAGSTNKNQITNSQKKLDYRNTGLANRLTNVMTKVMGTVSDYAGTTKETNDQSYLGKLITNLQTKMSTFKTQMNAFEKALYKKYDSMEVLLSNLGVQLNYITGYGN